MTKKKAERGSLEFYLEQQYPVTLYPDRDGGFVAEIKDLPGCMTQGETAEEALAEVEDARVLWLETAYEYGDDIPLPSNETQYSGKTLLRMPRSLHQKLAEGADREGVSLNQYIVSILSEAAGAKTLDPLKEKIDAIYQNFCQTKATKVLTITGGYVFASDLKKNSSGKDGNSTVEELLEEEVPQ
jgi:antitoxin HicB